MYGPIWGIVYIERSKSVVVPNPMRQLWDKVHFGWILESVVHLILRFWGLHNCTIFESLRTAPNRLFWISSKRPVGELGDLSPLKGMGFEQLLYLKLFSVMLPFSKNFSWKYLKNSGGKNFPNYIWNSIIFTNKFQK